MKKNRLVIYLFILTVSIVSGCGAKYKKARGNLLAAPEYIEYPWRDNTKSPINKENTNPEKINMNLTYKLPIIMYHRVYTEKLGEYCITPEEFENDLIYIRDNGYSTITISELISFKEGNFDMPDKPIVLTFDDCNYNNYSHVFPLLKKHNMKAVFFIIGEFSERFSGKENLHPATSHMSFADIAKMHESGLCDIQNHTYDFHDWTRGRFGIDKKKEGESYEDYRHALVSDISKTQQLLTEKSGITPNAFAYPFGVYNEDAENIIAEMGFKAIITATAGMNEIRKTGTDDILRLKRYNRPHGEENVEYILKFKARIEK